MIDAGLRAVGEAIGTYRSGGRISSDDAIAWLTITLADLRVRDDAWARMDPGHMAAHRRLWTDVVRRAQPGYVAAPAALLAFTAWQAGDGALANVALDRALADTPGYTMALLLRDAIAAGAPPSMAVLPMTPEEVAASYADPDRGQPGRGCTGPASPGPMPRATADRSSCAGRAVPARARGSPHSPRARRGTPMSTRCSNAQRQPGAVMDLGLSRRCGRAPRCPRLGRIHALARWTG